MSSNANTVSGSQKSGTGERIADKLTFLVALFIVAKVVLGVLGLLITIGIFAIFIWMLIGVNSPHTISEALSTLISYATGGGFNQIMAWILLTIVVSSLLPSIQKKISGNQETEALKERVAHLETELSNASQEILQLQEDKSFEIKLKQAIVEDELLS